MPIVVRPATPGDRPSLLALFRTAFGADASADEWAWKYDRCPHPSISVGAFDGTRALGFFGGLGTRLRGAAGDRPGVSAVDVMTDPAARTLGRRGLFQEVAEEFFRENGAAGAPFVLGFPNDRHRLAGERTLAYRSVEPARQWTRPLPSAPPYRRSLRGRLLRRRRGPALSAGHDSLAEAVHARAGWRSDRSRQTLDWRFAARPGVAYEMHELLDLRGRSRAYASVRLAGERALLVDLLAADETSGEVVDLLDGIVEALRETPARTLELRAGSASPLAARAGELGFSALATDTHFTARALDSGFDVDSAARAFDYRFLDHDVF
ncbi:MAG TPA: GNAT family N-acetyltransferase [Thermoanaerobaculia bacterium]|nr:GNAT family N-acetyltransferase [Thermoanaerobaculia bacterium]